jgi:ABC-type Zn uptake system ZnuABC Zn-binding protein ZnuA
LAVLFWLGPAGLPARAETIKIVTSIEQYAALARIVGGDRVEVRSLVGADRSPRGVEPKPSLLVPLSRADLLIESGWDLEMEWLPELLSRSTNSTIQRGRSGHLDVSQGIDLLYYGRGEADIPFLLSVMAFLQTSGEETVKIANPYYHLDPANGAVIAKSIAAKLTEIDPDHAADYRMRLEVFVKNLEEKTAAWDAKIAPFKGLPVVFDRHAWDYLARRHGLSVAAYIEPKMRLVTRAAAKPIDPSEVSALAARMKAQGVRFLVQDQTDSSGIPEKISQAARARRVSLPISVGGDPAAGDYFAFFDLIYDRLASAFIEEKGP